MQKPRLPLLLSFIFAALIGFYYGNKKPETVYGAPIVLTKYVEKPTYLPAVNKTGNVDINIDLQTEKIHVGSDTPANTTVNIRKDSRLPERIKVTDTIYVARNIDLRILNKVAPLTISKPRAIKGTELAVKIDR
jgi:hypothetical protein